MGCKTVVQNLIALRTKLHMKNSHMLVAHIAREVSLVVWVQGTTICEDCKGTGFRAKWMDLPEKKPQYDGPIDPLY